MFELPEYTVFAKQMNNSLTGSRIVEGSLGNSPHKFVWYNRSHDEFAELIKDRVIGNARPRGRWLFVPVEPDFMLVFGENGGKILLHEEGAILPKKYHLYLKFEDGSFLTATTQMWGAFELYKKGEELNREYIKDMRPTPVEADFTLDYFNSLIDALIPEKKRSVKALLTQEQLIPGLGNSIAQDIMFRSGLNPRHNIATLTSEQRITLFNVIRQTIEDIVEQGGRNDEVDLYGNKGGYVRLMDKNAAGKPCPVCGSEVVKTQYLGGACYFCPTCQPAE